MNDGLGDGLGDGRWAISHVIKVLGDGLMGWAMGDKSYDQSAGRCDDPALRSHDLTQDFNHVT